MFYSAPIHRLIDQIAEARASNALSAILDGFADLTDSILELRSMKARVEQQGDVCRAQARSTVEAILSDMNNSTVAKLSARLVEADAIIAPLGHKQWLSDAHRASTHAFNRVLAKHANGEASLSQADSARVILSATRQAMQTLGRPIEQSEKRPSARTGSKPFAEANYRDPQVRKAIVMWVLGGDAESGSYLEGRAYDRDADRFGCISTLLDAQASADPEMIAQARTIAASILAADATHFQVQPTDSLLHTPIAKRSLPIGALARARARDSS